MRFPEGEVYEDVSVMFPVVESSGKIGLVPDVLYRKRSREDSITQTAAASSMRDLETSYERLASEAAHAYPELSSAAERFLERGHVARWLAWTFIRAEDGGEEACEGVARARSLAMRHRQDLVLPADRYWVAMLWLLRVAPFSVHLIRKARRFVRRLRRR